jgi:hypothetical protein
MRETLEMSVQLSKDPKWKEKEHNNLYYIPFFIHAAWNAILYGFISTGIIEINKSLPPIVNLNIFIAVGILSFILLIRYFLYGMVYSIRLDHRVAVLVRHKDYNKCKMINEINSFSSLAGVPPSLSS